VSAVQQVAASLIRAWQTHQRQPTEGLLLDNEGQAYEVQRQVAARQAA
jgi:hypothetical protein